MNECEVHILNVLLVQILSRHVKDLSSFAQFFQLGQIAYNKIKTEQASELANGKWDINVDVQH